jgi:hypothetical protein
VPPSIQLEVNDMASGANSASRSRSGNTTGALDDIDAGWEDTPESAIVTVRPSAPSSLAPVVAAPRPRSSIRELASVIEIAPCESTRADDERAEEVRDDELMDASAGGEDTSVSIAPVPSASELDIPDFRRRQPGRTTFAALLSAAALVVAGVAWSQRAGSRDHVTASVAAPVSEPRVPERAPEPRPSEPATLPASPTVQPPVSAAAPALDAVEPSPEKAAAAVAVTVKTVPAGAVIFRAGQRLGTGVVEVSVERNGKQRLTALLDGYIPSNFALDGSRDTVTVVLKRASRPRSAPVQPSDSPFIESNQDSTTATTATTATATTPDVPAAAPAPDSTAPAVPTPDVPSNEPSPE